MTDLVARTGRHQQRYKDGRRLVAGCIPFRYRNCDENCGVKPRKNVEVLMINSQSGPGLLFPKGGWENDESVEDAASREALEEAGVKGDLMACLGYYHFKSKTEGRCKATIFALLVNEEFDSWPEQDTRDRRWLTVPEAVEECRYPWMRTTLEEAFLKALDEGFLKWHDKVTATPEDYLFSCD